MWNAADPSPECRADGLYGNFGRTWRRGFEGYAQAQLDTLPRVTTATGVRVGDCGGAVTESVQAHNYMNVYLAQFARGWAKTFIYEFIDDGDGRFGFYGSDYTTKRMAADCLHNLTSILHDDRPARRLPSLGYVITPQPVTVHARLLAKSDGSLWIVVWGERVAGADEVTVRLPRRMSRIAVYDPVEGTEPLQRLERADEVRLTVSDGPLIVELHR